MVDLLENGQHEYLAGIFTALLPVFWIGKFVIVIKYILDLLLKMSQYVTDLDCLARNALNVVSAKLLKLNSALTTLLESYYT